MKIILVLFVAILVSLVNCLDPLVRIDQGLLRGQKVTGSLYSYFLGIPYAKVDLNKPFGAAEPPSKFEEDVFDAYDGSVICPQMMMMMPTQKQFVRYKETVDCLRLNIYVPYEAGSTNPLPVLVWIHGGVFAFGFGTQYNPVDLVKQGIIVVTINYRLGPYGFMCLDSPFASGNQGLRDQNEALRWIRNNIAAFGGNPYSVTIAGQSAGSCSTLLHLYSPQEKLFNKVIAQSGTPLSIGMFTDGDFDAAIKLAQYLNFNTSDTDAALEFLAQQTPDVVTDAAVALSIAFRPCKEAIYSGVNFFVQHDPFSLTNLNKVRDTPILIGHTNREKDSLDLYGDNYFISDPFYDRLRNNFEWDNDQLTDIAGIVRRFYIGEEPVSIDVKLKLGDFESDYFLNYPVDRVVDSVLKEDAGPIYQYVFSYVDKEGATAASHSAELPYLFNFDGENKNTEETRLLTERLTTLWANFVKYGNPTPEATETLPLVWKPVTATARPYLDLDKELQLKSRVYHDRISFWGLFYSMFEKYHKLTCCSWGRNKRNCNL